MTYIGASFNIYKRIDDAVAPSEIANLQKRYTNLSFAGLQEIDWRLTHEDVGGWEFYQGGNFYSGADPIIWDWRIWPYEVAGGDNVLCPRRVMDDGRIFVERSASWVVLENDRDRLGIVNVHWHSDVQRGRGVPNGTLQQADHFASIKRTIEIANSIVALYECPVVIVGDFNVDFDGDKKNGHVEFPYYNMTKMGFSPVWDLGSQPTRTGNPYDGQTIDYAYGKGVTFTRVRTPNQWNSDTPILSDHLPVIFDFDLNF